MKRIIKIAACLLPLSLSIGCNHQSSNQKSTMKDGIILVTFGSSYEAPQKTFAHIEEVVQNRYSQNDIRWGYTSKMIIKKLREGRGEGALNGVVINNDTPAECLEKMANDGHRRLVLQSLHIIPGEEFDELQKAVHHFEAKHTNISCKVGLPLLTSNSDIKEVARIMANEFTDAVAQGPVCFMGHGTPHAADVQYLKLQAELQKINPDFFVGTVEGTGADNGSSSVESIINHLGSLASIPESITVAPLMSIVGNHAQEDLNGDTGESDPAKQSWRERFEGQGYKVTVVMKGLADYDEIVAIWMQHLSDAINNSKNI
nr:sirohydrochlorin cobaltochelatase [uncultured Carboxylicivirga sp.]